MKLPVQIGVQQGIAFGRLELLLQLVKHRDLGRRGVHGGETRGRSLKNLAHGVKLDHLLLAQLRDHEPAAAEHQ
jgi:hypothetical protein